MTISILSASWSAWLIVAVLVCAGVLFVNVRGEIRIAVPKEKPAPDTLVSVEEPPLSVDSDGLSVEQVIAAASYYWLHSEE